MQFVIAATSPANTCGKSPPPSLATTRTITVTAGSAHATPTPGAGHATPTPTTGGHGGSSTTTASSGPCPPLPNSFCQPSSNFPWWLLCLLLLGLLALFLILLLLLLARRNREQIVSEEDITSQVDPDQIAPMGAMRYVRSVRVTTQTVNRRTGAVINSHNRDFDEFVDAGGTTHRRPRA